MFLLLLIGLLNAAVPASCGEPNERKCFAGLSAPPATKTLDEIICIGAKQSIPIRETIAIEALRHLRGTIEFRNSNLAIAEEVVASMEDLLQKMPSFPCNETLSAIISIRTDALKHAISLARRAYFGDVNHHPVEEFLIKEICRACTGVTDRDLTIAAMLKEMFDALNNLYSQLLGLDRAFLYDQIEGANLYCVPAAIWATSEAGVDLTSLQDSQTLIHDIVIPLSWYDTDILVQPTPWEQLVDRLVLPFTRLIAKLVYELQLITAVLNPDYQGHEVAKDLFAERNFVPDVPYSFPERKLHIAETDAFLHDRQSTVFTVIYISNLTANATIETLKNWSTSKLSTDRVMWLEDSFREPWYHNLRPVHLGVTVTAATAEQSTCWRRHSAGQPPLSSIVHDCLPPGWIMGSKLEWIDASERWRIDNQAWQWRTLSGEQRDPSVSFISVSTQESTSSSDSIFVEYKSLHDKMIAHPSDESSRFLLFTCNPWSLCGGHGDRINGLTTAFVLAVLTDRALLIDIDSPIPLGMLLQPLPDSFDWRVPSIGIGAQSSVYVYIDKRKRLIRDLPLIANDRSRVISFAHNHRDVDNILTSDAFSSNPIARRIGQVENLISCIWHALFQPSIHLGRYIKKGTLATFGDEDAGHFIAIHFRSGDRQLDKWWDPKRHGLETLKEFIDCAHKIERELSLPPNETKWFLSSDTDDAFETDTVRELGDKILRLSIGDEAKGEDIVHIDRSSDVYHQFSGVTLSYVNYYILQRAKAIVLSRSFFGETAAEIGRVKHAYFYHGCVRTSLISS
ncbi:hypothetical protein FOL47_008848 [Perkinsus chesapeaki]|uniref:Uncharacterized protein n=1 Tax=Perkinsus chesapeaki TaxID=330153 RepID=A0A7J6LBN1_PERCH|nr:hypothetical protein FOL47_008848 [Perkinsus chesapeaki]